MSKRLERASAILFMFILLVARWLINDGGDTMNHQSIPSPPFRQRTEKSLGRNWSRLYHVYHAQVKNLAG